MAENQAGTLSDPPLDSCVVVVVVASVVVSVAADVVDFVDAEVVGTVVVSASFAVVSAELCEVDCSLVGAAVVAVLGVSSFSVWVAVVTVIVDEPIDASPAVLFPKITDPRSRKDHKATRPIISTTVSKAIRTGALVPLRLLDFTSLWGSGAIVPICWAAVYRLLIRRSAEETESTESLDAAEFALVEADDFVDL